MSGTQADTTPGSPMVTVPEATKLSRGSQAQFSLLLILPTTHWPELFMWLMDHQEKRKCNASKGVEGENWKCFMSSAAD